MTTDWPSAILFGLAIYGGIRAIDDFWSWVVGLARIDGAKK